MPIRPYGVLKGKPTQFKKGVGKSPHCQVLVTADGVKHRIAINVKSKKPPSELTYVIVEEFTHPLLDKIVDLPIGFTPLESKPNGMALDYIRGNLLEKKDMRILKHDLPGPNNDLNEKIEFIVKQAIDREDVFIYAFGAKWGPEAAKKDQYFNFLPGNGIHDIHMNQGNVDEFTKDDGVWQDGGIIIHYSLENRFTALFLAFQSQSWHTDDATGHTIDGISDGHVPDRGEEGDQKIFIISALVNPGGDDKGKERVTLLDVTSEDIDLTGWVILNKQKKKQVLSGLTIKAGESLTIPLTEIELTNNGGIITLLDKKGLKVHGVSYTKSQAKRQGWVVKF